MKQKTKQELKDEIVTLTMRNKTLEIWHKSNEEDLLEEIRRHRHTKADAKRATIAAYALLATLTAIVVMEFGI